MCNFIIQEAKEKVNEIKLKTDNDFALEKQMMVHNAKLKMQQDFKQMEKDIETQKRIVKAKAEGSNRVKLMNERELLIQSVKDEAIVALLPATSDKKKYQEVLKQLIIQGLVKINESNVQILCRECDVPLVKSAMIEASPGYIKLIKEATGATATCNLTLNPDGQCLPPPPDGSGAKSCAGGVKLLAHGGRLILDNTLDSRIEIAYEQLMPSIRSILFSTKV